MSYTVLARKYRPQSFKDLVGQEHVSRTLGNAITSSRVAHAFLFTGARGVGKTTTARLLAKALNCERGPTPEPCNQCDACREITVGNDIDVLEIDGASNNSVDDVRRLQETLPFRPARDRFKVVIVDEVHMLSPGAFNAFLKTLEEPPEHVKFVFATTEIHKVPVTIRSRCQRYDFRLIPHAVISARLREILAAENIESDDAAVSLVAREAAGSMRDALTVLDQVLALGGERLEGDAVARGLGVAGRKHVWATLGAVLEGNAAGVLRGVHEIAEQGFDVLNYTRQLLECSRDLVVFKVISAEQELLELSPEERDVAKKLSDAHSQQDLERLFSGLNALMEEVGLAGMPKLALEMGLVRLSDRPALLPLGELLERLASLEGKLGAAAAGGGAGGGGGRSGPQRSGPPSGGRTGGGPGGSRAIGAAGAAGMNGSAYDAPAVEPPNAESVPRTFASPGSFAPPSAAPARSFAPPPAASSSAQAASLPSAEPPRSFATPPAASSSAQAASLPSTAPAAPPRSFVAPHAPPMPSAGTSAIARAGGAMPSMPASAPQAIASPSAAAAPQLRSPPATATIQAPQSHVASAAAVSIAPPTPAPPLAAAEPASREPAGILGGEWLRLVQLLKTAQPALAAVLDHGSPVEVSARTLKIGFPENSFFGRQAQSASAREGILRAAEQVFGAKPELVFVRSDEKSDTTLAAAEASQRKARQAGRREAALRHPRVQEAIEVFGETEQSVEIYVDTE